MRTACAIVWDLDGTLYRGKEPLDSYAGALAGCLPDASADTFRGYAEALLTRPQSVAPYRDLWNALTHASHELGLPYERANAAFLDVRRAILRGEIPIDVPAGTVSLVRDLDRLHVPMVVVTNSDGTTARALLRTMGFACLARRLRADAMKPDGFGPAVHTLFGDFPQGAILSVGDNYANDIAPALKAGMSAVHVTTPGAYTGPAHLTVSRLEDALAWIEDWALSDASGQEAAGYGGPLA